MRFYKDREKKIEDANDKREEEELLLQKRVRAMYENGNTAYLSLILNSENITDFILAKFLRVYQPQDGR